LGPNETRTLSIRNLTSNILCKRHNEALSPLDAMAGKFFSAVRNVHDDVLNRRTLSRLGKWLFFSGEELEFWLLKTAVGLFHSGNVARDRAKLSDTQMINPACYRVLYEGSLSTPCGLYVEPVHISKQMNQLQLQPLSDDSLQRMVGFRMTYLSF